MVGVDDALSFPEALLLGLTQGITEFLPISSSGHLALLQYFLGLQDVPLFFDVMLHVGTLAAVLFQYRRSLLDSARQAVGLKSDGKLTAGDPILSPYRLLFLLILATLPAVSAVVVFRPSKPATETTAIAGQPAAMPPGDPNISVQPAGSAQTTHPPESTLTQFRSAVGDLREHSRSRPWTVLSFLTITGIVLMVGSRARLGTTDAQSMRWYHAVGIGVAQAFSALCPGLSRSGMTVSTGLLLGLRGDWAVHFSLLMSIPAILGAVVLKASELDPHWLTPHNIVATLGATITSAVVGWLCIRLLLGSVARRRWWWFSIYVWLLVVSMALVLSFQGPSEPHLVSTLH